MSQKQQSLDSFLKQQTSIEEEVKYVHPLEEKSQSEIEPYDEFIKGLCSWEPLLKKFMASPKMKGIFNYVKKEYAQKKCYPPHNLIFNAFAQTPLSSLKVVIVGQDPYINEGEAMGLCFSIPKGIKVPPSLSNIYKNLTTKTQGFKSPNHGDLTKWANQGVFLLNAILTVEAKKSNSHKDCGWAQFTDEVISVINSQCEGVVFLLWGKPAQLKAKKVERTKQNTNSINYYIGTVFLKLHIHLHCLPSMDFQNQCILQNNKTPIDWNL